MQFIINININLFIKISWNLEQYKLKIAYFQYFYYVPSHVPRCSKLKQLGTLLFQAKIPRNTWNVPRNTKKEKAPNRPSHPL